MGRFLKIFCAVGIVCSLFYPRDSFAGPTNTSKILLIVNGAPITELDLAQRIKLVTLNSSGGNIQLSEAQKAEVMESLIQERLQIKAARDKKVVVTPNEIEETLNGMAKDNNMTGKQLVDYLKSHGISRDTLSGRIRAQLYWTKYIRQQYGAVIHVSDSEVEKNLKSLEAKKGQKEFWLAEIFIHSKETAQEIVDGLRSRTKKFEEQAREFSKSSSAQKGGDLGWVSVSRLEPAVAEIIKNLRSSQISDPIKVADGYKIMLLKDVRYAGQVTPDDMEVGLAQAIFPLTPSSTQEEFEQYGPAMENIVATTGCESFKKASQSHSLQYQETAAVHLSNLPDQLKTMIKQGKVGKTLQPVMTQEGLIVTMICKKKQAAPVLTTKEDVMSDIEQEKYGKRAARELQRIKATACIECKDESARKLLKL